MRILNLQLQNEVATARNNRLCDKLDLDIIEHYYTSQPEITKNQKTYSLLDTMYCQDGRCVQTIAS